MKEGIGLKIRVIRKKRSQDLDRMLVEWLIFRVCVNRAVPGFRNAPLFFLAQILTTIDGNSRHQTSVPSAAGGRNSLQMLVNA
jgi:hypothetical protein